MQAVRVLGRVHQLQDAVLVDALGQRELDDVAGAGGVLVELADDRLDLLLRGGGRQVALNGGDPDLGAVAVLARDVLLAARVLTDQDGAEAGRDALLPQGRHAGGQIGLDRGCGGLAIENLGGHAPIFADGTAPVPIRASQLDHRCCTSTTHTECGWTNKPHLKNHERQQCRGQYRGDDRSVDLSSTWCRALSPH